MNTNLRAKARITANGYPADRPSRDRWVETLRPARASVDALRPNAFFIEKERAASGAFVDSLCILLANRECPWRCVMCDLWRHTLNEPTPVGAVPAQLDYAFDQLKTSAAPGPSQIKLYNSGSFFDAAAIPLGDHPAIAQRLQPFERVVVECHPALVGDRILPFRDRLAGKLEVAMGLETIHPEVLPKLNKGMSLDLFQQAAKFLRQHQVDLRVFVLIQPPWLTIADEAIEWTVRSVAFAFDCGATVVSIIPTRPGNGAMEELARTGHFQPPSLQTIESALDQSLALGRGRVFVDLWELERFASCAHCFPARCERLRMMNEQQQVAPKVTCARCRYP